MIHKIYSVYDSGIEAYMTPFYMDARGRAVRAFMDTIADPNSTFAKHPQCFTLFELGQFDDSCAKFELYSTPVSCGTALELQGSK